MIAQRIFPPVPKFIPITLTVETEQEARILYCLLNCGKADAEKHLNDTMKYGSNNRSFNDVNVMFTMWGILDYLFGNHSY